MEINEVKELLNQFNDSNLTEFDLREGSFELYMNKNQTSRQTAAPVKTEQVTEVAPVVSNTPAASNLEAESTPVAENKGTGQVITSPIVGIVYLQPSPEQEAYKSVGDTVKQGETVCIIEAMKFMNEVVSEVSGKIVVVLVEDGEFVEFGQPLFRVQ